MQNIKNLFFIILLLNCFSSFNAEKGRTDIRLSIESYDRTISGFNISSPNDKQINEQIAALSEYKNNMSLSTVKNGFDISIRYSRRNDDDSRNNKKIEYFIRKHSYESGGLKSDDEIKQQVKEFKNTVQKIIEDLKSLKK